MNKLFNEIKEEVSSFVSSKTIDALIAPTLYVIANIFLELNIAIIISLMLAFLLSIYRIYTKNSYLYSLGGLVGVTIASLFAYFAGNAANYFLPKVISSGILFVICMASLIMGKPLAAIASHLSRSWDLNWYFRDDIKPAYTEVTLVWCLLILTRMIIQLYLLKTATLVEIGWANLILGFPTTLSVLILSFVYGSWRLKNLKGPGIDEFRLGIKGPWKGQRKGF